MRYQDFPLCPDTDSLNGTCIQPTAAVSYICLSSHLSYACLNQIIETGESHQHIKDVLQDRGFNIPAGYKMSNLVRKVNTHLSKGRDPHEPLSICKTGNTPTSLGPYCDRAGISAESFLKHDISSCGNIITCGLIYELERYRRKNGYPSSIIGHLLKSECAEKALQMSWSRIYERVTKMKKTHKPTESYLSSVYAIPRSDIPFAFSVVTK